MTCQVCARPAHGPVWGFLVCLSCAGVMNARAPVGECIGLAFVFASCILFALAKERRL